MLLGVGLVWLLPLLYQLGSNTNGLGQGKHSNGFILQVGMQRLISMMPYPKISVMHVLEWSDVGDKSVDETFPTQ
jgi:hypothetical protein